MCVRFFRAPYANKEVASSWKAGHDPSEITLRKKNAHTVKNIVMTLLLFPFPGCSWTWTSSGWGQLFGASPLKQFVSILLPRNISSIKHENPHQLKSSDEVEKALRERDEARARVVELEERLKSTSLSSASIENDDKKSQFYTGLLWEQFFAIFSYLTMISPRHTIKSSLPLRDKFFVTDHCNWHLLVLDRFNVCKLVPSYQLAQERCSVCNIAISI